MNELWFTSNPKKQQMEDMKDQTEVLNAENNEKEEGKKEERCAPLKSVPMIAILSFLLSQYCIALFMQREIVDNEIELY